MRYSPYPQYKDSGVAWLGEVPGHWDVKKMRYLAYMKGGSTPSTTENQFWDDGDIPWVSPKDMKIGRITDTQDHLTPEGASQCASGILAPGHVLIVVRSGILRHSLPVAINDVPVTLNQDIRAFKLGKQLDAEYLRWFIVGNQKLLLEQWCKSGTTVESIEMSYLADGLMSVPPKTEQTAIADFLDRETGRIDTLAAKKRKLVELLKEKRSALISRTVTRGLPADATREFGLTTANASVHEAPATYGRGDFNRPQAEANQFAPTSAPALSQAFKESGVESLGKIPTHWEVKRLKFVFPKLYSGVSVNSENIPATGEFLGILKTSCVYGNKFYPEENKQILEEEYHRVSCQVTADSLIVSRMNTPELVGSCGYVDSNYPNLFLPDRLWIARFSEHGKMHGKFAWYLVSSDLFVKLTAALATGTSGSMKNLSQEAFLNIEIAIPDYKEQTAIAAYLDRETAKIDRLIEKIETAMARLQEYRSALITAAVTGKIDVREAA